MNTLRLSHYKTLFEQEFVKDVRPPKDYYLMFKRSRSDFGYDLSEKLFYGLKPPFSYTNKNNELVVHVKKNKIKTLYLTYMTLDTKFENVPKESFVNLEKTRNFYINIELSKNKNVEVIPYIVQYNKLGKKNMIKITKPMQFFKVDEDVIKLRLVFKCKGHGNFIIRSITRRDLDVK